jgi:hypothetical protein
MVLDIDMNSSTLGRVPISHFLRYDPNILTRPFFQAGYDPKYWSKKAQIYLMGV